MTLGRSFLAAALFGAFISLGAVAPAQAACPEVDCLPPTDVHGVSSTKKTITVAWTAVENAPSYRIRYSTTSDFSANVSSVRTAETEYLLSSLQPGTKYYFKVAVYAEPTRLSDWSEPASFKTLKPFAMRVGTYNIKDPDSRSFPAWTERGPIEAETIVRQSVRLIGLQELYENDERAQMLRWINEKAGGDYYAMTPDLEGSSGRDSRIVYDTRVLQRIQSGGKVFDYQDPGEQRSYAWAKFLHIPSGKYVFFTTTHLEPSNDTADVEQWRELIRKAQSMVNRPSGIKVIMTGDYNVTKFEQIGADMFAETRAAGFDDVLGQQYRSYSTYRNPDTRVDSWISSSNRGKWDIREYSVSPDKNGNGIDHIFISSALKVPYYEVHAQPRTGYMMNYLASDHFLVIANLKE